MNNYTNIQEKIAKNKFPLKKNMFIEISNVIGD